MRRQASLVGYWLFGRVEKAQESRSKRAEKAQRAGLHIERPSAALRFSLVVWLTTGLGVAAAADASSATSLESEVAAVAPPLQVGQRHRHLLSVKLDLTFVRVS